MAAKRFWKCGNCEAWNAINRLVCRVCHDHKRNASEEE